MRPAPDLVEREYAFTQLSLLNPVDFIRHVRERGVALTESELEALHRSHVLVPLLRASRDGRSLRAHIRDDQAAGTLTRLSWEPKWYLGTQRMLASGAEREIRLHDPATEQFAPWSSRRLLAGGFEYPLSSYLYSPHQSILLPIVKQTFRYFSFQHRTRDGGPRLIAPRDKIERWRTDAARLREAIIAASALEARYYPNIVHQATLGMAPGELERYDDWLRNEPVDDVLRWLHIDSAWLYDRAAELLGQADSFDPLGDWLDVVRIASPESWSILRGDARIAMDFRVVAELLLAYNDALNPQGQLAIQRTPPQRRRAPVTTRLGRKRSLDQVLTRFGISPHPRLVLVLEGATEVYMWPRLVEYFDVPGDDDFISVVDAGGVDRNLEALVVFAAPRTVPIEPEGALALTRPLTRFLIVGDAEGKMATPQKRDARRNALVRRLLLNIDAEYRSPELRRQLGLLVHVETWSRLQLSFEFAHFTPRQIAAAIRRVPGSLADKPPQEIQEIVTRLREGNKNLKALDKQLSKRKLAAELWPILERRLNAATKRDTLDRIPFVRILDRAMFLAQEPRQNVLLGAPRPVEPPEQP